MSVILILGPSFSLNKSYKTKWELVTLPTPFKGGFNHIYQTEEILVATKCILVSTILSLMIEGKGLSRKI